MESSRTAVVILFLYLLHYHRFVAVVEGHGFVYSPKSRSYLCSIRQNANCGQIIWEPQSVEGIRDFPDCGPKDGELANGGSSRFKALNEYGMNRWNTSYMQFDSFNETHAIIHFDWRITVSHSTESFRVFLTNPSYKESFPITRKSLYLNPICEDKFNGKNPLVPYYRQTCIVHKYLLGINVGKARGFYAVWDIADNYNAFYQWIDFKTKFPIFTDEESLPSATTTVATTTTTLKSRPTMTTNNANDNDKYVKVRKADVLSLLKLLKTIMLPFVSLLNFM